VIQNMRVLKPSEGVLAFYDGRVGAARFMADENWVDDGALSLGIASYALVAGDAAIVYDTHVSLEHARFIRSTLEQAGVRRVTVVLSHWHLDHVAGSEVFQDCEIIANERTASHLARNRAAIEAGTHEGPPAIEPLVMPTRTFSGSMTLDLDGTAVELIEADIHSDDATVMWVPALRLLFAGDTMEDTVNYVVEPEGFDRHLADLDRLFALDPARILPNHGDPDMIAAGGYQKTLARAMQQYIRVLKRCQTEPAVRERPLAELIAGPLSAGWISWFDAYETVHKRNLKVVCKP
jgi:cyclase